MQWDCPLTYGKNLVHYDSIAPSKKETKSKLFAYVGIPVNCFKANVTLHVTHRRADSI